jgi:acylphosphatase
VTRKTAMAEKPSESNQRREIHFSGWVQGVGFRYTTRDIAARFDVAGYVKNLPDGRVLVVVEGAPATVDEFVKMIESTMRRYIQGRQERVAPATGEFTQFEIRR